MVSTTIVSDQTENINEPENPLHEFMTDFSKRRQLPILHCHYHGYKLCLEVDANGYAVAKIHMFQCLSLDGGRVLINSARLSFRYGKF